MHQDAKLVEAKAIKKLKMLVEETVISKNKKIMKVDKIILISQI